jgi:hypothetical protein
VAISVTVVLALVVFLVTGKVREQVKIMKTLDTAGKILVTLDQTLPSESSPTYDVVSETKKRFPSVRVKNNRLIDDWGAPIDLSVAEVEHNFQIVIRSAGPDGVMQTADDVIRSEVLLPSKPKAK